MFYLYGEVEEYSVLGLDVVYVMLEMLINFLKFLFFYL